jgi:hypothetical protein
MRAFLFHREHYGLYGSLTMEVIQPQLYLSFAKAELSKPQTTQGVAALRQLCGNDLP